MFKKKRIHRIKTFLFEASKGYTVSKRDSQIEILLWIQLWVLLPWVMRYNAQKLGGAEKHKEISNGIEIYAQGMRYSLSVLYNILRTAEEMLFNRRSASIFSDELLSISRIPWNSATVLEPSHIKWQVSKKR